jgi:hypothetical protein
MVVEKTMSEYGEVTSIPCSQEVGDVTTIPSTSTGVKKRLRRENSSLLHGETVPLSLQFEMTTKKFVQRLYILLGTANIVLYFR